MKSRKHHGKKNFLNFKAVAANVNSLWLFLGGTAEDDDQSETPDVVFYKMKVEFLQQLRIRCGKIVPGQFVFCDPFECGAAEGLWAVAAEPLAYKKFQMHGPVFVRVDDFFE